MKQIRFEWDENKNRINIKKHNISFEEARTVFYDENAVEFYDDKHVEYEDRFILLGISYKLNVLIICYCVRESSTTIRIISARKATKKESDYYPGGI